MPSEFSYDLSSEISSTPELFEPKRAIQKQLQKQKLPYTLVSANGFMEAWYLGEQTSIVPYLRLLACTMQR